MTQSLQAKVVEHIVAIVNKTPITLTEVKDFKNRLRSHFLIDEFLFFQGETPKSLLKNETQLLSYLIKEKVIDSIIEEEGIFVSPSRVNQEIQSILRERRITEKQLEVFLKDKGFKLSQYRLFIETSMKRMELIRKEISSKVKVSEEDIASYYLNHKYKEKDSYIFKYTLAHVYFSKDINRNKKGNARKKVNKVFKKLTQLFKENPKLKDLSFERLISEFTEEKRPSHKTSQGEIIGSFTLNEMLPAFQKEVKSLKVNHISKPIETDSGFHILKLVRKNLISNPKLERKKEEIRNILLGERFKNRLEEWLDEKHKVAFIHRNKLSSQP